MEKDSNIIFGVKPVIEAINAGKEIDKLYIQRDITGANLSELRNAIKKAKINGFFQKYPDNIKYEGFGVLTTYNNDPSLWDKASNNN